MHLCAFLIAGPVAHSHAVWRDPQQPFDPLDPDSYRRVAATLERGKFDFLFFADRLAVSDIYGGNHHVGVRYGDQDATRLDPVAILAMLSATTSRLGLGATRSTSYDQPYHVAREFATLDHLSRGRAAWNVVTSMNDAEARNFGVPQHLEHDLRYDRADEFVEVARALWDSWDPDALVLDRVNGIYADPARVRAIDYVGRWFQSRGPLNVPRSPQGRPVIIQAGSSGRGMRFAARWADVVFTIQQSHDLMRRFRTELKSQLAQFDRRPEDLKVLTAIMPFVGTTATEAIAKRDAHNAMIEPLVGLSTLANHMNDDLSKYPLEGSARDIRASGTQGMFAAVARAAAQDDLTLAQVGTLYGRSVLVPQIAGTAAQIADEMQAIVESGGADGFVISPASLPRALDEFVDGVVPELQHRGLFRRDYEGARLRDHLGLADPKRPTTAPD
ncbi:MAG: LLM class flavin-dependent oxidoreductase [Candidatus Velthaea sp.]